ncbi:MAG: SOS response-associated peptidase family protein, partial [Verrucomicrobiota bacterium]
MCTSYALRERDERIVTREFGCLVLHFEERPKIAPPQRAPVVLVNDGHLVCMEMGWGVKQHWSERLIVNAQWETLSLRPTFIRAFRTHR